MLNKQVHHYPHQRVWVALTLGVFGFFGIPVYPIGNELAVEATYPVGEATSTGVIFMLGFVDVLLSLYKCNRLFLTFENFFSSI